MSAPNKNYDPVEVTALPPDEVDRALDDGARRDRRRRAPSTS